VKDFSAEEEKIWKEVGALALKKDPLKMLRRNPYAFEGMKGTK
jgi:hypothetical protein